MNSFITKKIISDQQKIINWYLEHKRNLPWRQAPSKKPNPYMIWISEVMLQQTTVTAVIPFFNKFISRFPDVKTLAESKIEDVYEYWAGLGYYSRARNLHKAAQAFYQQGFPQTAAELIQFPGFGPYTSRAVASLAFSEPVGVLDGNVIRVLSRKYGLKTQWWKSEHRDQLQKISDALAQTDQNSFLNQALMELGATVCTPKKVMCLLCPWSMDCVSFKENLVTEIPLKKPKDDFEIWKWTFFLNQKKDQIYLQENQETPFLKKNWLPPSKAEKLSSKPKKFLFKHGVTKYEIFIDIQFSTKKKLKSEKKPTGLWTKINEVSRVNPTSLMKKIIQYSQK